MARVNTLKSVLTYARNVGLVVDLSFAFEVVANRSFDNHMNGIGLLANELAAPEYDHVMFDLQNEIESVGCPRVNWIAQGKLPTLLAKGRQGNSSRIVFASTGLGSASAQITGGGMVAAVHEPRDYPPAHPWWLTTAWHYLAMQGLNYGIRVPIYAQEPDRRWHASWGPCGGTGDPATVDNPCELTSYHFYASAVNARLTGAAAWTFHTEALFFPDSATASSLRPWGVNELEFLDIAPYTGGFDLIDAMLQDCWGYYAPPGWFPSQCQ
jgi:hypothetical protein